MRQSKFHRDIPNNAKVKMMTEHQNEQEVFVFLDNLRESGVTNMYGASPYIRERFECTRYEANRLLSKWMETFGERHPA